MNKHHQCAAASPSIHSTDIVEVWHGAPTPIYVCGYHESQPSIMRQVYADAAAQRKV